MITEQLISPKSIVIVGGSDDTTKPGGNALRNLIKTGYKGKIYVVNPKTTNVQGQKTFKSIDDLPPVDCAILAIPAQMCVKAVEDLCEKKFCKAIIIFSAGFSEDSHQGAVIEKEIVNTVNKFGASLIGPNCIGIITPNYAGVFTQPVTNVSPDGIDIISGSGATVVFIMEAAIEHGLTFSHVFSVGNSAQIGVEDALKYLDETYVHGVSSPVKLLYIESISNPQMLLKHAKSLISKGASIAAVKAGYSEAGSRAASSHTGALASPDMAVSALFRKAGIIRAYSRGELVNIASALKFKKPKGNKIAIITHAGGPAVMLTDILCSNGIEIPKIDGQKADELLSKLFPGSSVSNPIDFLATGTAQQLSDIIDACNNDFNVDSMAVIFGSPGLTDVSGVYDVLLDKLKNTKKPIYPILPSVFNAKEAIEKYHSKGGISFNDEVSFGKAFVKIVQNHNIESNIETPAVDYDMIRSVIDSSENGYLTPHNVQVLLDAAGINRAKEFVTANLEEAIDAVHDIGYPIVMKVVGPIHKTDVGGVSLNISDDNTMSLEFARMMKIKDATAVLLQPMLSGTEIFIGAKREGNYGTLIMCGLGGVFIEALKDVNQELAPISKKEGERMIKNLKGYKIIQGIRGLEGVNEMLFNEAIRRVSALCIAAPEIAEMDLNPLLGNFKNVTAVDGRIRIEK